MTRLSWIILFFCFLINQANFLLIWPKNSILQLSMAVVSLVESPDLNNRKVQVNSGWQTNFNLPTTVRVFTNPVNFPGFYKRSSKQIDGNKDRRKRMAFYEKYRNNSTIINDVSAGALYNSLRDMLPFYGYHEECLERAICEMSQHPLHRHEDDVFSELLHLVLTPSEHKAFDTNEEEDEQYYMDVEALGRTGGNCEEIFHNCKETLLDQITTLIETEELRD